VAGFALGEGKARRRGGVLTRGRKEPFGLGKLSKEQDSMLLVEGFEPAGGGLWRRDGTYFGREAALQNAHSGLLQRGGYALYDRTARGTPRAEEGEVD
jgi:hypothetical protein